LLPEGLVFLAFWPLSKKLKEKFLCDICDWRSPAGRDASWGGESMYEDLCSA
jgi:hypothetical protein